MHSLNLETSRLVETMDKEIETLEIKQEEAQNKTSEVSAPIFEVLKTIAYHTALLLFKIIVIPVEIALLMISGTLTALALFLAMGPKFSLENGEEPRFYHHFISVFNELSTVTWITMTYGYNCNGNEKLQLADANNPDGPEFIVVHPTENKTGTYPILYAPGYLDEPETFVSTARELANAYGAPIYLVKYRSRFQSIKEHAKDVGSVAQRMMKDTGQKEINLLGHSMGGLSTGEYMMNEKPEDVSIRLWTTIGTPLTGTPIAALGLGTCAREMEPGSEFLQQFDAQRKELTTRSFHMITQLDHVVPASSTPSDNTHVWVTEEICGHLGVRSCEQVKTALLNELNSF